MIDFFQNKTVAVTGACGTIGYQLVKQLLEDYPIGELIGLDNNESQLFFLEQRFSSFPNSHFFLGDVRDRDKLNQWFEAVDIVFHTAAFKHVILCERSPFEAVQTNIIGVKNVIQAAIENNVSHVVFTSSDKAVNPTNVMGTSKLMGERLMTAANSTVRKEGPIFASTRFGNVLGSRGSVIPIFKEQIKRGGPVTLTEPDMTRFIMSIKEAVRLVIDSAALAKGGEVFVTKMPVINIKDLAEVMIQELAQHFGHKTEDIQIDTIGAKPGEKLYEELMTQEETRRAVELPKYFAILPAFSPLHRYISFTYPETVSEEVEKAYHSANEELMTQEALQSFLRNNDLLQVDTIADYHPDKRYWPDGTKPTDY